MLSLLTISLTKSDDVTELAPYVIKTLPGSGFQIFFEESKGNKQSLKRIASFKERFSGVGHWVIFDRNRTLDCLSIGTGHGRGSARRHIICGYTDRKWHVFFDQSLPPGLIEGPESQQIIGYDNAVIIYHRLKSALKPDAQKLGGEAKFYGWSTKKHRYVELYISKFEDRYSPRVLSIVKKKLDVENNISLKKTAPY